MEGENEIRKKLEIRTMAKDLARLREGETDKQREKIVAIKTGHVSQQFDNAKIQKEKEIKKEEIRPKNEAELSRAAFSNALNREGNPIDRLKEMMEAKRAEKTLAEQRPNIEENFFKKSFDEKKAETPTPPEPPAGTTEQIAFENLQKIEQQRERERQEREAFLQRVNEEKIRITPQPTIEEIPVTRFPLISVKKIPSSEKIWVRVLVLSVCGTLLAVLFTYWYWAIVARKPVVVQQTPVQQPVTTPVLSQSLIPVTNTTLIKFDTVTDLKTQLASDLKQEYPDGQFRRIAFGDNQKKQYLTTQQLFEDLDLNAPPELFQKIDSDFTFFVYSRGSNNQYGKGPYNRFGIIVKIKNRENLTTLMKQWEPSMENDLAPLFTMIGKTKTAIVPYFRTWTYSGYDFRFQTFEVNDIGICYVNVGDYFVITASGESIRKVIDLVK